MPKTIAQLIKKMGVGGIPRMSTVTGFAANSSAVLTDASGASPSGTGGDIPLAVFLLTSTGFEGLRPVTEASTSFRGNRIYIASTASTKKTVLVFWWDVNP